MKGMGADGIAHVVHTDPTLIEAHCNSSSMQITGFARREQQKDRRWFKKIKDMSDIFAWKAPRDLNCPPDWTPIIHFTMAHQVVDAIATWHDDNVPSDQFPTHRMYYIPLSDKLRQQWHDLDKIHHFSHGKEEQLDNMTVGVTPQTILNLIHVSQQRQGRAVYCDGTCLYLKIINRATFVDIAMRDIKWLHLTHSAMAHAKAADAMLLAWTVIHGEGVAADHFRTYYLDDRYTLWYYKCLGIPGK
jgi:hypothetical protein